MQNFRRTTGWIALGAFSFIVLSIVLLRLGFSAYLNSSTFRKKISDMTAHALKANGDFQALHLAGSTIYSDGFLAQGTDAAFFSKLCADQLRADFNWRGLLRRAWQIDDFEVQRLEVNFAERQPAPQPREPRDKITKPSSGGWTLDLRKANVRESRWTWDGGAIDGTAFTLTPFDNAWRIDAQGGTLAQAGWPALRIESARLRYQSPSLFISDSTLHDSRGTITVSGEVNFDHGLDLQVVLNGIDVMPLLANDWRARLTGKLFGDTKVRAPLGENSSGGISIEGSLRLADAQLTALPVLDQIALFTRTETFRRLPLTKVALDFSRDSAKCTVRNVVVESEGLIRVEGKFTIVNGQLDGAFQVGVSPTTLQWLPGSQSRVFTASHDGYLWTPMRMSGPVEHPNEDLTERLVVAAAGDVIEHSEGTIRKAAKDVLDLLLH